MKRLVPAMLVVALSVTSSASLLAQERPYKEGPVVNVSFIQTLPGQQQNYLRYVFGDYARIMEAEKQAGIILEWSVLLTQPRTPEEADVILTITYPNMAALDNLAQREDAVMQRVLGQNVTASEQAYGQRERMRKVLGSQLLRVLLPR